VEQERLGLLLPDVEVREADQPAVKSLNGDDLAWGILPA
jgi:hypothetical protein